MAIKNPQEVILGCQKTVRLWLCCREAERAKFITCWARFETSRRLKESHKTVSRTPCVSEEIQKQIDNQVASANFMGVSTYVGEAKVALLACDVVLSGTVKSGTVHKEINLEAALIKRPMVVE